MQAQPRSPRISFGVPVYNEEKSIGRCLDSILGQDFADFEIVVSDNASTDRTCEVVAAYVARDARVRLVTSPTNQGLIHNFNRVFQLARGEFFRWVGADDWLEPAYASRSVAALEADPGAIVATTDLMLHDDQGRGRPVEFQGERLESEHPARRFARVLWFVQGGELCYEPLYSLIRREVLARTGVIRNVADNDLMLVAELSLLGRFTHVSESLFHRGWRPPSDRKRMVKLLTGKSEPWNPASLRARVEVLLSIVAAAELSTSQRVRCYATVARFSAKELGHVLRQREREFRRDRLGLTRERFRNLFGGRNA